MFMSNRLPYWVVFWCLAASCSPSESISTNQPASAPGQASAGPGGGSTGVGGSPGGSGGSTHGGVSTGTTGAGSAPPGTLDSVCTPKIVVQNMDSAGSGKLFDSAVADAQAFVLKAVQDDCAILYRQPAEVPTTPTVTLVIENIPGVAFTSGAQTHVSSQYLQQFSDSGRDLRAEIDGVLHHEFTHIYQHNNANSNISWVIEGTADFVRLHAGLIPVANRKKGGNYDASYQTTAFFFDYLDKQHPDFVYKLNQALAPKDGSWTLDYFKQVTGTDVATLWAAYQNTL